MTRRATWPRTASVVLAALTACSGMSSSPDALPPKAHTTFFVAPNGDDGDDGSRDAPWKTITRALASDATRISLAAGRYPEANVEITASIELVGPGDGAAVIDGAVAAGGGTVLLSHVEVTEGVVASGGDLTIGDAVIAPGQAGHAIHYQGSTGLVERVEVTCGAETCIQTDTSTVRINYATLTAAETTKRALRVESSSVTAKRITASGSTIMQLQVGAKAFLHVLEATLSDAEGSALGAVGGARLVAERVEVLRAKNIGVVLSRSDVVLRDVDLGATGDLTLGIQGGNVKVIDASIARSARGVVSISNHTRRPAEVEFIGGVISHGTMSGISLGQGHAVVRGTRFLGAPGTVADGGDAITASGITAHLDVTSMVSEHSAGFGVAFYNNAFGTVSATVTNPRLGGVIADTTAGAEIRVRDTVIVRCAAGSGVVALDALDVHVSTVRITGCPEGGVLAGAGARVTATGVRLTNNLQYGLAAFGAAQLEVRNSTVRGSGWSTFATCTDGARVVDGGGNDFDGPTTNCP